MNVLFHLCSERCGDWESGDTRRPSSYTQKYTHMNTTLLASIIRTSEKTYKLTQDVLVLMINGERVDSFHRVAAGDWSIESFRAWAINHLISEGYEEGR